MSTKRKQTGNNEIMNELQNNQALLKTILWRMEQNSPNSVTQQVENATKCNEFKKEISENYDRYMELPA